MLEDRRVLSTISGVVWDDLDGDGVRQAAEPGLPDRAVYLDANENGRLDAGEATTTSDAAGGYTFAGLPSGNYTVRQALQPGWQQTLPAGIVRAEVVDQWAEVLAPFDPTSGDHLNFGPDGDLYLGGYRFDGVTGDFIDRFLDGPANRVTFGPNGDLYGMILGPEQYIHRFDGTTGQFFDVFAQVEGQPEAMTFGPDGDIYVSDHNGRVLRYDGVSGASRGDFVSRFSGGLQYPKGLTFGPGGDLFVTITDGEPNTGRILRYDGSTGAFRGQFVITGSGGLYFPAAITFGPDGDLYVVDGDPDVEGHDIRVLRYNGTTGAFMGVYVQTRNSPGFGGRGLTFGSQGDLYLDVNGEGILRFQGSSGDQPGELIDVFSPSTQVLRPRDFSFGPDGNVYVSSTVSDTIERYNPTSGEYLGVFVASGAGGLDFPTGNAWSPDGNLYVASAETDEILRYDGATGRFLGELVTAGRGGLDYPVGIEFGPDGRLYVASSKTDEILRYDAASGEFAGALVSRGSGGLDAPAAFTFGPDGALYVGSDSSFVKNDVLRYDGTTGKFTGVFALVPSGRPYGLEFGPDGNLYAGRWSNPNGVLRFDGETGALIDEFIPSGFGGLTQTSFVHFGPDGLLYASGRDSGLHRYELIDRTWSFLLGDEQHRDNINFGNRRGSSPTRLAGTSFEEAGLGALEFAPGPGDQELGFTRLIDANNDGTFGDEDFGGVYGVVDASDNLTQPFTDGSQGYETTGSNGGAALNPHTLLTFDAVDLSPATDVVLSLDVFVAVRGYETTDLLKITVEATRGDQTDLLTVVELNGRTRLTPA
ncbi:MAG: SMP-30/gluconolactonase/LRE family protein [Planctomycetes bacterium]|nr:SMP-30/gluconolactonase/LRE family protein [Planctomycetota bacterium]